MHLPAGPQPVILIAPKGNIDSPPNLQIRKYMKEPSATATTNNPTRIGHRPARGSVSPKCRIFTVAPSSLMKLLIRQAVKLRSHTSECGCYRL
jgi:hypothetical protein